MISEIDLINGCKIGDKKAQRTLYDKYAAKMLGVCIRYFRDIDEAEDALQEGFIKIFKNIDKFRNEGSFEGWIRRIMVNTSLNYYKSNLKHYYGTDYDEVEEFVEDEKLKFDNLSVEYLLKIIQDLPEGYRLVFKIKKKKGYSNKEKAEMLDISINTSKSQLMKAKRNLQKVLVSKEKFI